MQLIAVLAVALGILPVEAGPPPEGAADRHDGGCGGVPFAEMLVPGSPHI